ncbi:hypothetical protein BJX70DRAFT_394507 [Aspergillus crustosus]
MGYIDLQVEDQIFIFDEAKLKAQSGYFAALLSGRWTVPGGAINLEDCSRETILHWKEFIETGKYTYRTNVGLDAYKPLESFKYDVTIYTFSDKYLIGDLRDYSRAQARLNLMQIWEGFGDVPYSTDHYPHGRVVDMLHSLVESVYKNENPTPADMRALVAKTARFWNILTWDNTSKDDLFPRDNTPKYDPFSRDITSEYLRKKRTALLDNRELISDCAMDASYFNFVFGGGDSSAIEEDQTGDSHPLAPPSLEWYQDEVAWLERTEIPNHVTATFLPPITQLVQAGEIEAAEYCVQAVWGMDLRMQDLSNPHTIRSLCETLQQNSITLNYANNCHQRITALIKRLSALTGIPGTPLYDWGHDVFDYAPLAEIVQAAGLKDEAAAQYLKEREQEEAMDGPHDIEYHGEESMLENFIRVTGRASEAELAEIEQLSDAKARVTKMRKICGRPAENVQKYLLECWNKSCDFFRSIAIIVLCLPCYSLPGIDHDKIWRDLCTATMDCDKVGRYSAFWGIPDSVAEFAEMLRQP